MRWLPALLASFLGLSAASALTLRQVHEWSDSAFNVLRDRSEGDASGPALPSAMALYGGRVFFGYPNDTDARLERVTFAWLPSSNRSDSSLHPFQTNLFQDGSVCDRVQSVLDLEVDEQGQLWVLEGSSRNCRPSLRVFDAANNDSLLLGRRLTTQSPRNIAAVLATGEQSFAMFSEYRHGKLFDFQLEVNKTRTQPFKANPLYPLAKDTAWFVAIARPSFYACNFHCREIININLREQPETYTSVGNLSSVSKGLLMDKQGIMYFLHEPEKTVTFWDSKGPFTEQELHKFASTVDSLSYALDEAQNLWVLSHDAGSGRFSLLKGEK